MPDRRRTLLMRLRSMSYRYRIALASFVAAVLLACGVGEDGHRDVLGCSVSLSEALSVFWSAASRGSKATNNAQAL